ncbi:MAG: alpha/beta hydrolase domain-containing protein, partial [Lachnospiraceae bacterium]|nr:alpha/beta hydrolase domain-containing protein [Lachnospiraceae bacterium]
HAPKIETEIVGPGESDDPFGAWVKNQTDAFGNAKGGIRFPAIDYPTARYQSYSRLAEGRVDAMFGTTYPLPAEVLRGLYGNLEQYRRLVEKSAWECVKKGFLLEEDLAECVERLVEKAAERGL